MNEEFELIVCICNQGFSDLVMTTARSVGVRGGTIINARGTAKEDIGFKLNIPIHPEKEIVLMVLKKELKDDVLHAIYNEVGLKTEAQSIAFTLPVSDVAGIK